MSKKIEYPCDSCSPEKIYKCLTENPHNRETGYNCEKFQEYVEQDVITRRVYPSYKKNKAGRKAKI